MSNALKIEVLSNSIRWAVNINEWIPSKTEWVKAMKCIQPEERQRIRKFRYQIDAKASIVGRLLMRLWASKAFEVASNDLEFTRTDRGRPSLDLAVNKGKSFFCIYTRRRKSNHPISKVLQ